MPRESQALTARQREILHLAVEGKPTQEIAAELSLSVVTVRRHLKDGIARLAGHVDASAPGEKGRSRADAPKGYVNRDLGEELLSREMGRAARQGTPLTVVMLKAIGPGSTLSGDRQRRVARRLLAGVRHGDLLVQWDDETFLLILPQITKARAALVAERLQSGVEEVALARSEVQVRHGERRGDVLDRVEEGMRLVLLALGAAQRASGA